MFWILFAIVVVVAGSVTALYFMNQNARIEQARKKHPPQLASFIQTLLDAGAKITDVGSRPHYTWMKFPIDGITFIVNQIVWDDRGDAQDEKGDDSVRQLDMEKTHFVISIDVPYRLSYAWLATVKYLWDEYNKAIAAFDNENSRFKINQLDPNDFGGDIEATAEAALEKAKKEKN